MCTRTQGKEAVTPQETEPDLTASAGESPVGAWVAVAHHGDKETGSNNSSAKTLIGMNSTGGHYYPYHRAYRLHGWLFSGKTTNREGGKPHPSADNWIKILLSMTLPTRQRSSFPHHQSLSSKSLHRPLFIALSTIRQTEEVRRTTILQPAE